MDHRNKRKRPITEVREPRKKVPPPAYTGEFRHKVPISAGEMPGSRTDRQIVFRFDCVDLEKDCPWSMANMTPEEHRLVLEKLKQFESCRLGEITSGVFKDFTVYSNFSTCPNPEPIERLGRYYDRESDSLARFRLGGTQRLYGFLVEHEFHVLWWDPRHEIWPSEKKHT